MIDLSREVVVDAAAGRVWDVLTDWRRHGDWVPLTTITVIEQGPGVGTRFVARTAVAGLGMDDVMEVTHWSPPPAAPLGHGRCEVVKQGRVVRGRAVLEVHGLGPRRSRVIWTYRDLWVFSPGLTRWIRGPLALLTGAGLDRVLAAAAVEVCRADGDETDQGRARG